MYEIYEKISSLVKEGKEFVLAIVINAEEATAGKPGFKMLILPDGTTFGTVGGGTMEKDVIDSAMSLFNTKGTILKKYVMREGEETSLGMICGGSAEVYIEYVGIKPHLVIFGAGHIGKALYDIVSSSDVYDILIVDDREEFVNNETFPLAQVFVKNGIYRDVQGLPLRNGASIVIVTPHGTDDASILKGLYEKNLKYKYIGMIGSTSRRDHCFESARNQGVSEEFLENIYAPVGLAIGAETPFEIAVSIIGEIVALNKGALQKVKTEKELHKN